MSTDAQFYTSALTLQLGVDGMRPFAEFADAGCCPDVLCTPFCDTACSFIALLPSGPMWDKPKADAKDYFTQVALSADPCDLPAYTGCTTMVSYALYGARVLNDTVQNIVWPAVRESSPITATTTTDDWLLRFGWDACYRASCESVYYQIDTNCEDPVATVCVNPLAGTEHCPATYPADFAAALKHATLLALSRMQRGVIKNIDGLNWVIAPLGAVLAPRSFSADALCAQAGGTNDGDGPPCFCDEVEFNITSNSATLPGAPVAGAKCAAVPQTVAAAQTFQVDDLPLQNVFPGVLVAAALVKSMLIRKCPNIVYTA